MVRFSGSFKLKVISTADELKSMVSFFTFTRSVYRKASGYNSPDVQRFVIKTLNPIK